MIICTNIIIHFYSHIYDIPTYGQKIEMKLYKRLLTPNLLYKKSKKSLWNTKT